MKILIIDDETSLRRTLRIALESMGHAAAEARDAKHALDAVHRERFDAAFGEDGRLYENQGFHPGGDRRSGNLTASLVAIGS